MNLLRNLLFWIVLALLGAIAAHFILAQDPGYVLVRWRGNDYHSTVLYATWIVLGIALVLWIAWTLLTSPFRAWSLHRDRRHRARIGDGFEALHEGHYARAEKLLADTADDPQYEAASRIGAAQAAIARGDHAAAQAQLDAFGDRHPALRAIALAELAMRDGRPTDALVALDAPAVQPLPPRGLALRADALARSGHTAEAYGLLGSLRKHHAWTEAELSEREVLWAAASLREGDENAFAERWEAMPKSLKTDADVVGVYATRAAALGWDEAATGSIERALDARWDEQLATLYGRLPVGRIAQRRAHAERWLQSHPGSLALPATLARLAQAEADWAGADTYWRQALATGGAPDDWESLGDACAARGDDARARQCYANALRTSRGESPIPIDASAASALPLETRVEDRDPNGLPRLRDPDHRDLP